MLSTAWYEAGSRVPCTVWCRRLTQQPGIATLPPQPYELVGRDDRLYAFTTHSDPLARCCRFPWVWLAHLELLERTLYFFSTSAGGHVELRFLGHDHDHSLSVALLCTWIFLFLRHFCAFGFYSLCGAPAHLDFSAALFCLDYFYLCGASLHWNSYLCGL